MTWSDVLMKHWVHLSEEVREKMREYYHLRAAAQQQTGRVLSEIAWKIEKELKTEARKRGWPG